MMRHSLRFFSEKDMESVMSDIVSECSVGYLSHEPL